MLNESNSSTIKNPLSIQQIISMIVILSLGIQQLIMLNNDHNHNHEIAYFFLIFWLSGCSVVLLFIIYRVLQEATEIKWGTDNLFIHKKWIVAKDIDSIMIYGYLFPMIGIKPKGKRIVPDYLCFRFIEDKDKAMKQLNTWAEANGIRIIYKKFMKWL
ncbi:hypothetical protein H1230_21140 [Paenibacillus sp. 19GGS1-52]|uniref:hypothetical protein n=1 Tax=Paenibacillus sp. 19GGS1-52 TaxID=2758563 RepID=UPI001EFB218B|nr:hypothetical protein [Paenibacillus sp. 19GGS1-52]ULO05568.1 hypothetical protein H1230_21140 [Paenibacillus sp. 19GGS1-52]